MYLGTLAVREGLKICLKDPDGSWTYQINRWSHGVHKMEALKNYKESRSQMISIDFIYYGQDWVQYLIWFPPLLPCTRPLLQLEHSKHPFVQLSPTLLKLGRDASGWLGGTHFLDQKACNWVVKNPSTGETVAQTLESSGFITCTYSYCTAIRMKHTVLWLVNLPPEIRPY